jgi:anti-sigma regulatory factor (Ser/Thr protein kinase)
MVAPLTRAVLEFDGRTVGLAAVRRFVVDALARWGLGRLSDDALIVVSELVTNVVEHAHTAGTVRVSTYVEGVRIEVEDASTEVPVLRFPGPDRADGHGLSIVEHLATEWGWAARPGGKVVWVDLMVDDGQARGLDW